MSNGQNINNPVPEAGVVLAPILRERRRRILEMGAGVMDGYLRELLEEVDAALRRIDQKTYGICASCHEPIETDRLLNDPLVSFCLDHLSAILRSLISLRLPIEELMPRANRIFCEGTLASHYATLVCGSATADGLEISNAGHCPPLVLRTGAVERMESSGLPLGMFCRSQYAVQMIPLNPGESVVLYTDGLVEARDARGNEFGEERLIEILRSSGGLDAHELATTVLREHDSFTQAAPPVDDLTLLVIRRRV